MAYSMPIYYGRMTFQASKGVTWYEVPPLPKPSEDEAWRRRGRRRLPGE